MSPLDGAHTITKLPAQDLDRARAWYRDVLGLEPAEEREGGLRYLVGSTEFHLFASSGKPTGETTQMGFEVDDARATIAELRARGLELAAFDIPGFGSEDGLNVVPGNYPSKGTGELGAFFFDSEGNLIGIAEATGDVQA